MSQPATIPSAARWPAVAALLAGVGSLVLLVFFFVVAAAGPAVLGAAVLCGGAGVVLGIVALRRRLPKGLAITGLVLGAAGLLLASGIFVFALIFIGALAL